MDVCWGRRIKEQKEEEVGEATVARSSRRHLGARAGCSAVNDSRETHTRVRLPSSPVRDSAPTPAVAGTEPGALASPAQIPRGHVAPERAAHDSRATETRHLLVPPPLSTCPFRIPSLGARATP